MPNRLIHEKSPYLLQHAHNPVDWYPWGEEALEKARREKKPILLSVGYSACHWCHVMERESFENEAIAAIMNEHFVNIKVDREERPDIDHVYQTAAQLLSGQGGWPLTVFLTPDQRPFFAGTYFPPEDRYGRPGFARVLRTIAQTYRQEPDRIDRAAKKMTEALQQVDNRTVDARAQVAPERGAALLEKAVAWLSGHADDEFGGFGFQPKFPNVPVLELFLRHANRRPDDTASLAVALRALDGMADGGIYDHLGGGFHRYATDRAWRIPHFEKMLYDNALLPVVYLHAYQITKNERYARVVRETLEYVEREMSDPAGGFYSAQDADSEGEEGKFFVWTPEEFDEVLGEDSPILKAHFGVVPGGNFERGATVLHIAAGPGELSRKFRMGEEEARARIEAAKRRLFAVREKRTRPGRDDKVILAWNALMISAFARAARVLGERRYLERALRAVRFVEERMTAGERLVRSYKEGPSNVSGFLDDYAFWVQALVDVYEACFDRRYLVEANRWMEIVVRLFWDDENPGFFLTAADQDQLIHRPKDWRDQSIPSGTAVAVSCLLRLHPAFDRKGYEAMAGRVLETYRRQMDQNPWGTAALILAYDAWINGAVEVVLVAGPGQREEAEPFLRVIAERYVPHLVVHVISPEDAESGASELWKEKRQVSGAVTAYVCKGFACSSPITVAEELARLL